MNVHLQLTHNRGFAWHQRDGWHVKGFLFGPNDEYLQGDALIDYLESKGVPTNWLPNSNGHFTIIYQTPDTFWVAVDKLRAFPLFYHQTATGLIVSDDAPWLQQASGLYEWDELAAESVRTINSVTANSTLFKGLNQMQAGQWMEYDGSKLSTHTYYQHLHPYVLRLGGQDAYIKPVAEEAEKVFERLVNSLKGRAAIIPLSGGHDSRFIAAMLKKLNYPNVICYTYGRKDSPEVAISKHVAEQLGFPWYFVEYTPEVLEAFMGANGDDYRLYGAQLSAIAHEQDWFAVAALLQNGLIPKDGVVIPGYCGDFPAGSYLPKDSVWQAIAPDMKGLVEYIYQNHFARWGDERFASQVKHMLQEQLVEYTITNRDEFESVYEHWLTINRLSRFIVNAVRVYEYYGLQWRMPLWDDGWVNLWYNIPNEYRRDRALYKQYLDAQLFQPLGIQQNMAKVDSLFESEGLLTKIKALTPKPIRQGLKKLLIPTNQQDANRLQWLAGRIYQEIQDKSVVKDPTAMNHVHACWYLETVEPKP